MRQFCTFFIGQYLFGIDVQQVQEILRSQELTRVPLAPPVIRGLMNLRGQIVTAIDLRHRLALGEHADDHQLVNVVVRAEDGAVSLLVDEIGEVVDVTDDAFELPPETVADVARELLIGAYKLETRLLLILDTDKVMCLDRRDGTRHANDR